VDHEPLSSGSNEAPQTGLDVTYTSQYQLIPILDQLHVNYCMSLAYITTTFTFAFSACNLLTSVTSSYLTHIHLNSHTYNHHTYVPHVPHIHLTCYHSTLRTSHSPLTPVFKPSQSLHSHQPIPPHTQRTAASHHPIFRHTRRSTATPHHNPHVFTSPHLPPTHTMPPSTSLHLHQDFKNFYTRYMDSPNLPRLPPSPGPAPTRGLPALPGSEGLILATRRESMGSETSTSSGGA
jgi:hypothetical protein